MSSARPKPQFTESLFWDIDLEKLNLDECAEYVIERMTQRGKLTDWIELQKYYGLEKIKEVTLQSRYLDKYTLSFLATMFNIPQEEFRCYKFRQLNQGLWPY